jgi:tRNA nucleotidyltransferase (CCA-adding enzyme)
MSNHTVDNNRIVEAIDRLREEHRKVAAERDELKERLEKTEKALLDKVSKTAAEREGSVAKIASLSGQLVGLGLLPEEKEEEFRNMVVDDATELVGTCAKLASMVPVQSPASPDPGAPDDGSDSGELNPIERFALS